MSSKLEEKFFIIILLGFITLIGMSIYSYNNINKNNNIEYRIYNK